MTRAYLTKREKMAMLGRQEWRCAICGGLFSFLEVGIQFDHQIPDAMDKAKRKPDRAVHAHCHAVKTKSDVKDIARARRRAGETGQYKRRQARADAGKPPLLKSKPMAKSNRKIPSRPFPKMGKR